MRSRHSSNHTTAKCMEMEQQQREPHLSGAYIRSLVKQLSSSRPKQSPPLITAPNSDHPQFSHHSPPPPPPPQPPKKQVRRRLHTSRPYQERLLNMAEARREIVTALKFHRASMKQSSQQQQQQQHQTPIPPLTSPPPNPNPNYPYQPYPSFFWAYPSIAPLPMNDALALPLPNQPLGLNLNLNFQGFHDIEIPIPMSNNEQIPVSSVTASSSSSSVESSVEATPPMVVEDPNGLTLHPVMDAEDMREIRSLSEQHDMEWNDTMNLVTTAWWSKVLDGGGERESLFDESVGVPAWLTDGAGGDPVMSWELPQYFEGCLQEEELPCLDIEGIDGLNMDWLS